jgi:hypothetical protein
MAGRADAGFEDSGLGDSGFEDSGFEDSGFEDSGDFAFGLSAPPESRGLPRDSSRASSLVRPSVPTDGLPCAGARSRSRLVGATSGGFVGRRGGMGASSRLGPRGSAAGGVGVLGRVGAACRSAGADGDRGVGEAAGEDVGEDVGEAGLGIGVRGGETEGVASAGLGFAGLGFVGLGFDGPGFDGPGLDGRAAGGCLTVGADGRASRGADCCVGALGVRISRGCGAAFGRAGAGALSRGVGAARGTPGCGEDGARVGAGAAPGFEPPRAPPLAGGAARTLDASSVTPATTVIRVMIRPDDAERTDGTRLASARMRGPFAGSPTSIPRQVWISTLPSTHQSIPCWPRDEAERWESREPDKERRACAGIPSRARPSSEIPVI